MRLKSKLCNKYLHCVHVQVVPREYDLRRIVGVPMYLFYSGSDWLATAQDTEEHLLKRLRPEWVYQVNKLDAFNHNDFLWGLRAPHEVYRPIVEVIQADLGPNRPRPTQRPKERPVIRPLSQAEDADLLALDGVSAGGGD